MKRIIIILTAALSLISCGNGKKAGTQPMTGEQLLATLNDNGASLLVMNNGEVSQYGQRGVADLLDLITNEPEKLNGAIVADQLIGKAAAAIVIVGNVKEVHTNTICTPALQMLKDAGIEVFYTEEVPFTMNQDKTGQCPIEAQLNETQDAAECLEIMLRSFE